MVLIRIKLVLGLKERVLVICENIKVAVGKVDGFDENDDGFEVDDCVWFK